MVNIMHKNVVVNAKYFGDPEDENKPRLYLKAHSVSFASSSSYNLCFKLWCGLYSFYLGPQKESPSSTI